MMSLSYIEQVNHEQAVAAAQEGLTPFVYFTADEVREGGFPFPHIGDYEPEGWTEVDRHFVDASGLGLPTEPALTAEQFAEVIRERIAKHNEQGDTVGWAVVEAGQFQVYVAEFVRERA